MKRSAEEETEQLRKQLARTKAKLKKYKDDKRKVSRRNVLSELCPMFEGLDQVGGFISNLLDLLASARIDAMTQKQYLTHANGDVLFRVVTKEFEIRAVYQEPTFRFVDESGHPFIPLCYEQSRSKDQKTYMIRGSSFMNLLKKVDNWDPKDDMIPVISIYAAAFFGVIRAFVVGYINRMESHKQPVISVETLLEAWPRGF